MNAPLLFAAAIDIAEVARILIIVVVFLVVMIGKLIGSMRVQQRPPGPVNRPALPPQQPRPAPRPQAQTAGPKTVKEEIDEFLRRAAQKKQSQSAPADPVRRISQPTATLAQRAEPLQAELVRERPLGGAVSEHVKKYLDEKEFDERASKLGGEVAVAGAGLAALLNNIDNLRQAIVINEILQRPEDRWK
jgi:hypothetical protein